MYRDVFFRQGPPVAPQATGGPPQKTVAPSKNGGLFKYRRTALVQRNWRCLGQIWYEIKVKQVFTNFTMSLTANVGEWQYKAKKITLILKNDTSFSHNTFPAQSKKY